MRSRWLALAALLLLAGCGPVPAGPGTTAPRPTPSVLPSSPSPVVSGPQCLAPGVEVSVGRTDAAMGLRAVGIDLRNCGTGTYSVKGYPLVEVLDADLKVLDLAVLNGTEHVARLDQYTDPPKQVDIPPGGSIHAALVWRNITTEADKAATGAYLRIAPAAGQPKHTLALRVDTGNTGKVAVSPWTRV